MSSLRRVTLVERAGFGLAAVALLALGVVWHHDRTRGWESPRWDDSGLVALRTAVPANEPHLASGGEAARSAGRSVDAIETWAVAVNPGCALCRSSLAHGLAIRPRVPVRLAVLVVDTPRRPSLATLATLGGDELRWDSAGAWRRRWGHRVYGELLCFDRAGRFVRTLPPLSDSTAARHALRIGETLRLRGGS